MVRIDVSQGIPPTTIRTGRLITSMDHIVIPTNRGISGCVMEPSMAQRLLPKDILGNSSRRRPLFQKIFLARDLKSQHTSRTYVHGRRERTVPHIAERKNIRPAISIQIPLGRAIPIGSSNIMNASLPSMRGSVALWTP